MLTRARPNGGKSNSLRRRREAAFRLEPLADGRRDPLDTLDIPVSVIDYPIVTVADLGLACDHGDRCPAKEVAA